MSVHCCDHHHGPEPGYESRRDERYRRVLWIVLGVNAAMFLVEIGAGLAADSVSLQADVLDFLADAGNYSISLLVVGMALRYRAMTTLVKGVTMGLFGLWVSGTSLWHGLYGTVPHAVTMGAVGFAALAAVLAILLLGELVNLRLLLVGGLMALGVGLHLTEQHRHVHIEAMTHAHEHEHDKHHQHEHDKPLPPSTRHSHRHRHGPLTHTHTHFPDAHHRHRH